MTNYTIKTFPHYDGCKHTASVFNQNGDTVYQTTYKDTNAEAEKDADRWIKSMKVSHA